MAEFCKDCFIKHFHPTKKEIKNIVLSKDDDFCEGCGEFKPVVEYIADGEET